MGALAIMVISFAGYIIMYQLYGKFIGAKIFALSAAAKTPAVEMEDGVDYVPTKKEVIFGHHYTSIAGEGFRLLKDGEIVEYEPVKREKG